jgi:hypothetical protein
MTATAGDGDDRVNAKLSDWADVDQADPADEWTIESWNGGCQGCETSIEHLPWAWVDSGRDDGLVIYATVCHDCRAVFPTGSYADKIVETRDQGRIGFSTPETVEKCNDDVFFTPEEVIEADLGIVIADGCEVRECDGEAAAVVARTRATGWSEVELTGCETHANRWLSIDAELVEVVSESAEITAGEGAVEDGVQA